MDWPRGLTVPFNVAVVVPMLLAEPVVAVGAVGVVLPLFRIHTVPLSAQ